MGLIIADAVKVKGIFLMPIKPENKARYPKDWPTVSLRIRERAGNYCEGSPGLYPDCRAANGKPHPVTGSIVVLTVAHLNHTPEDCRDENLMAMCQLCHLTYDAKHHAQTRFEAKMKNHAVGDLFNGEYADA